MTTPLTDHLAAVEGAIADARCGLPEDVFRFISRVTPLINVDLLIKDERSRTLLTWRDDEFYGPGWHIPGGIIRYRETFADRVRACARAELGTDVELEPAPILVVEDVAGQETRGHHISLLFRCRILGPPDEHRRAAAGRPSAGQWRWHDCRPPDLIAEQHRYARFL